MSSTGRCGRLCNSIIRNVAFSEIAKQHNLSVSYVDYNIITQTLGIMLFQGEKQFKTRKNLTDDNYMSLLTHTPPINYNLYTLAYLQTQVISDLIYKELNSTIQKSNITKHNPFKDRYNNNNDLFIHIRLGDVQIYNPGVAYYLKCIRQTVFTNLYIGSDTLDHSIIKQLQKEYPAIILVDKSPEQTIQFGSTCDHIILSHGTFSAVIGYLSFFAAEIYYPDKLSCWCPSGLFRNKSWIPITC